MAGSLTVIGSAGQGHSDDLQPSFKMVRASRLETAVDFRRNAQPDGIVAARDLSDDETRCREGHWTTDDR